MCKYIFNAHVYVIFISYIIYSESQWSDSGHPIGKPPLHPQHIQIYCTHNIYVKHPQCIPTIYTAVCIVGIHRGCLYVLWVYIVGDKGNAPTIYTGPVYIVDNTYILWATQWTMSPTIYTYAPTIHTYAPTIHTHNIYRHIYCG